MNSFKYPTEFKYPYSEDETLDSKVLDSFPGIWFVTKGSTVVQASKNYRERLRRNWRMIQSKELHNGLVVNWLVKLNL